MKILNIEKVDPIRFRKIEFFIFILLTIYKFWLIFKIQQDRTKKFDSDLRKFQ